MARPVFWPTQDSYVMGLGGVPYAGVPIKVYAAQTGGAPLADLQYVNSFGAPIGAVTGGVLVSDEHGLLPAFAGPDGGPTTLWGNHGIDGERLALTSDPTGSGGGGGGAVSSVVGQTGAVSGVQILADSTIAAALTAKAPLASPAFTGTPTVPTAAANTSTTQAASTAFVMGQTGKLNGVTVTGTPSAGQVPTATSSTAATWQSPAAGAGDATTGSKGVVQLAGDLAGTAASPTVAKVNGVAVTGTPTAGMVPTATSGTAATWQTPSSAPVSSVAGRTGAVVLGQSDISGLTTALDAKAPLASPALTGTPTVPTATVDTATTQAASTAFVTGQAAGATPLVNGTAAPGTSTRFARGDHVHPTDTTRAATTRAINTGTGLTGGGDLSADRTLSVSYGTSGGTAVQGNDVRVVNAVQSTTVTAITRLTQAAYDALTPVATTLYVIVG